jgi:hypothetical protein
MKGWIERFSTISLESASGLPQDAPPSRVAPPLNAKIDHPDSATICADGPPRDAPTVAPEIRLIQNSGLFDAEFYLHNNPDVRAAGVDPLVHYLTWGWMEGRNPHPLFDTAFYKSRHPGGSSLTMNPLSHYLLAGAREHWNPSPVFDGKYYFSTSPDLAELGANPLAHFLKTGWKEKRNPHPLFDVSYYLEKNRDAIAHDENPLLHYLRQGWREGRHPHPLFDGNYYLSTNPDVAAADINPLIHFLMFGADEGHDPHPHFDCGYYASQSSESDSRTNPLVHYVTEGFRLGRDPNSAFSTASYVGRHPEVIANNVNPLRHYLETRGSFDFRGVLRREIQLSRRPSLSHDYHSIPLVSVVIVCAGPSDSLEDAVLSALLACSFPMEIVLAHSPSVAWTATLKELAAKYALKTFTFSFDHFFEAVRMGLRQARGRLIQIMRPDNLLCPDQLDLHVSAFQSGAAEDVILSKLEFSARYGVTYRPVSLDIREAISRAASAGLRGSEAHIPFHRALFRRESLESALDQTRAKSGKESLADRGSESLFALERAAIPGAVDFIPGGASRVPPGAESTQYASAKLTEC